MRELRMFKFRGWDKEEGYMTVIKNNSLIFENKGWFIVGADNEIIMDSKNGILMQWTGFQDKNGKDIYEGDIVKTELYCGCEYCSKTIELIKEVRFVNGRFIIEGIYEVTKEDYYDLVYFGGLALEVIGNIWKNPELLKE